MFNAHTIADETESGTGSPVGLNFSFENFLRQPKVSRRMLPSRNSNEENHVFFCDAAPRIIHSRKSHGRVPAAGLTGRSIRQVANGIVSFLEMQSFRDYLETIQSLQIENYETNKFPASISSNGIHMESGE